MKRLYFGDCLEILKVLHQERPEGFIDLIYIDPPFNSKRDYNILFESNDIVGDTTAQKQAFSDTWSNISYLDTLNEIQNIDLDLYQFLKNLDDIRIPKESVAYLTTMAIRIQYMYKVLKDTGAFYLHCDPTMSHYLKLVCDLIFGQKNFQNEIAWKRTTSHNDPKRFGNIHDVIFWYSKTDNKKFNRMFGAYSDEQQSRYKNQDEHGKYRAENLTAPHYSSTRTVEWKGVHPGKNRQWRFSLEKLDELYEQGRILLRRDGKPRKDGFKEYLSEAKGQPYQDFWEDIIMSPTTNERLGYPTQKPEELLERIIKVSSDENDLVADFFCGCGTTIAVAENLNRNWIGVDISHLAIRLVLERIIKSHGKEKQKGIRELIEIHGLPKDIASARELANNPGGGRLEFQDWIIEVMMGGVSNVKKSADGGFDGYLTFNKSEKEKETVLIEVKSGNVNVKNLREFIQVVKTKKAALGAFVCFKEQVTKPMQHEAKKEGYYDEKTWGKKFDKIQIVTVEDLFDGENVNIPESTKTTFKSAKFKYKKQSQNFMLFKEDEP